MVLYRPDPLTEAEKQYYRHEVLMQLSIDANNDCYLYCKEDEKCFLNCLAKSKFLVDLARDTMLYAVPRIQPINEVL